MLVAEAAATTPLGVVASALFIGVGALVGWLKIKRDREAFELEQDRVSSQREDTKNLIAEIVASIGTPNGKGNVSEMLSTVLEGLAIQTAKTEALTGTVADLTGVVTDLQRQNRELWDYGHASTGLLMKVATAMNLEVESLPRPGG